MLKTLKKMFALAALLMLFATQTPVFANPPEQPAPPPIDLSKWLQISPTILFGTNPDWPRWEPTDKEGINPAYLAWDLSPFDGRNLKILGFVESGTREITYGDPPITKVENWISDSSMQIWIGDDGNLHSFAHYTSEINGVVQNTFMYGMLPTPEGTTAAAIFATLQNLSAPLTADALRNVQMIPEPSNAMMLTAGMFVVFLAGFRKPGRQAGKPKFGSTHFPAES
jgi:hypothetical protein